MTKMIEEREAIASLWFVSACALVTGLALGFLIGAWVFLPQTILPTWA